MTNNLFSKQGIIIIKLCECPKCMGQELPELPCLCEGRFQCPTPEVCTDLDEDGYKRSE